MKFTVHVDATYRLLNTTIRRGATNKSTTRNHKPVQTRVVIAACDH